MKYYQCSLNDDSETSDKVEPTKSTRHIHKYHDFHGLAGVGEPSGEIIMLSIVTKRTKMNKIGTYKKSKMASVETNLSQ